MRVLFISSIDDIFTPAKPLRSLLEMQFGISYISSFLKMRGHKTRLIVLSRMLKEQRFRTIDTYLKTFSPRLICFTAVSTEYSFIARCARYIKKKYPNIYLCIGGPHVSLKPEGILLDGFDALCIGEGESPALELVQQLEKGKSPSGIANLWIKRGDTIEKNATRPVLQDLDILPLPDHHMWNEWVEKGEESRYPVLLGRGCPFLCTYCCNHALRGLAEGPYVRFRSPESILDEIRYFTEQYPAKKNVYLEVETIGANLKWALELCRQLEGFNATLDVPLSFGVNLRVTPRLDLETLFAAFQRSNFTVINIGIESGSERVRRDILKRNYSNQDIIKAVSLARKHGMKIHFYNLIGVPGETLEDFRETVNLNRVCLPDTTYVHIFYPYPGTELYFTAKEKGLITEDMNTDLERCTAVLDLPGFSKRQIQKAFILFDYYVFKGIKPMPEIARRILVSLFMSNSFLHSFYRKCTYSSFFRPLVKRLRPKKTPRNNASTIS